MDEVRSGLVMLGEEGCVLVGDPGEFGCGLLRIGDTG